MARAASLVRTTFAFALSAFALVSCVDLFHTTNFRVCDAGPDGSCVDAAVAADAGPGDETDAGPGAPDAATTDVCAWTSSEARAHANRACAWLAACEGTFPGTRLGDCVLEAQLAFDCNANPTLRPKGEREAYWLCVAEARTCGDLDRCIFHTAPPTCAYADGGTGRFSRCLPDPSGEADAGSDVRVECTVNGARPSAAESCRAKGQRCIEGDDGEATCATVRGGANCALGAFCSASVAVSCPADEASSLYAGTDCASFGAGRCATGGGAAACVPDTREACAGTLTTVCEGNVARTCIGNRMRTIDCGQLGLGCQVDGATKVADPLSACGPQSGALPCAPQDACDGNNLVTCRQGERITIACAQAGLGPCHEVAGRPTCQAP